jgi:RNA polymerase sigma factor (TIGR02999 family)
VTTRSGRAGVTELLVAWSGGDEAALDRLVPIVHSELRRTAARYMSNERSPHTLQATALVNEVYLRLVQIRRVGWRDRAHFFAMAARLMRRVLVDHARARGYQKRGGGVRNLPLDETVTVAPDASHEVVAVDAALAALDSVDARKARVVELRFFGGLSVDETAAVLNVSPQTVMRDWRLAKAWLLREMSGDHQHGC